MIKWWEATFVCEYKYSQDSAVVLVLHNTYNKKDADRLYFINATVRITVALHPAGILLQGFTCIAAAHIGQY